MKLTNKFLTGGASLIGSLAIMVAPAAAATTVVTPDSLGTPPDAFTQVDSWYFYDDNTDTSSTTETANHMFVDGPATPPAGEGSLKFENTADTDRWTVATNQYAGDDLSTLTNLGYSLYVPNTSTGGTAATLYWNLDIDFNNTTNGGYQGRLVYTPQDNGGVTADTWESEAITDSSLLRWSRFASNGNQWPDGNTTELRSLGDIKAAFPNAEVWNEGGFTGQLLIKSGQPGPAGLVNYLDSVVVNGTTFDFEAQEPAPELPTNKDQCKKGGWQSFEVFKNQGDCVSFVATKGRNQPSGTQQ